MIFRAVERGPARCTSGIAVGYGIIENLRRCKSLAPDEQLPHTFIDFAVELCLVKLGGKLCHRLLSQGARSRTAMRLKTGPGVLYIVRPTASFDFRNNVSVSDVQRIPENLPNIKEVHFLVSSRPTACYCLCSLLSLSATRRVAPQHAFSRVYRCPLSYMSDRNSALKVSLLNTRCARKRRRLLDSR